MADMILQGVLMWGPDASEVPTTSPPLSRPGNIVAGKFRVERKIAEGGMGVVVAATHIQLHQTVALKFLRADIGADWDVLARFMREARAAAQLKSEHVARVLDVGVTEDGTPYMVMEYLEGKSLAHTLRAHGPLDIATAAEYAIQTCEGLAEAHSRGIVHRDVKPENLFLVERSPGWRAVKILDFGISKYALSDVPNLATGVIMGSPCYMSPEQLRSTADVDHSADIWSLGATLHELLSGTTPFDSSLTLPELVTAIIERPAPSLHELRPEIPEELAAIVTRCLAKNKEDRYENIAQVALALLPFAPPRARGPAERAISMAAATKPKFDVIEGGSTATSSDALGEAHAAYHAASNSQVVTLTGESVSHLGSVAPSSSDVNAHGRGKDQLRRLAVAIGAAAGLLIIGLVVWAATVTSSVQGSKAPAQPVVPTAPTAASVTSELVELQVRVSPSSAQITVDGEPVPGNPFHGRYAKDGVVHQIRAIANGYRPKTEDLSLTNDVVIDISLERLVASAPAWPVAAPATPVAPAGLPLAARFGRRAIAPPTPAAANNAGRAGASNAPRATAGPARTDAPATGSQNEVSPAGGQAPLRPIDTRNPYGIQ
jgi:eukaryotic-like serine/threonine-protein kinase